MLHATGMHWGAFRKPSDKFVQELLCADLEVEGIAAILNTDVEELFEMSVVRTTLGRGQTIVHSTRGGKRWDCDGSHNVLSLLQPPEDCLLMLDELGFMGS